MGCKRRVVVLGEEGKICKFTMQVQSGKETGGYWRYGLRDREALTEIDTMIDNDKMILVNTNNTLSQHRLTKVQSEDVSNDVNYEKSEISVWRKTYKEVKWRCRRWKPEKKTWIWE